LTASPRLRATIPNETAPSKAITTHKAFVCHAGVSCKVSMTFLRIAAATLPPDEISQTISSRTHNLCV
jgi:hypothetical protein